jgi:hypothetical protein
MFLLIYLPFLRGYSDIRFYVAAFVLGYDTHPSGKSILRLVTTCFYVDT